MNPIEVRDVRKSFGSTVVLRGLSMSVKPASMYGLLGRNGAGKTTLLKILIGLLRASSGTAQVLGTSLSDGAPREKQDVAYVSQTPLLPSWASVDDLMRFDAAARPEWHPDSLQRWLDAEGIEASRKVGSLSAGQSKRVELELALAGKPSVLLLDEPFAGLDPVSRAEFIETLVTHAVDSSATVLLSSHILSDLERLCDRVGFLARGIIAHEDSMDALKARGDSLEDVGVELIRSLERKEAG
jgi:ABC-2 type transport system ATP-binding protein